MERKEQLISNQKRFCVEVSLGVGQVYKVQFAQTLGDLEEAKALDDLAFGSHLGITMKELVEINQHGEVLLFRNVSGKLLGESQIITSGTSQHPHVAPDEAYSYGTAIRPDIQSQGIAQILYKSQEIVAIDAGKKRVTLTVRLENAKSIRGRLKAGYRITGYNPEEYGSFSEGGARLIMKKSLEGEIHSFQPAEELCGFQSGSIPLIDATSIKDVLYSLSPLVALQVKMGDEIDHRAHPLVNQILQHGYVGIGLLKPAEYGDQEKSLFIFIK